MKSRYLLKTLSIVIAVTTFFLISTVVVNAEVVESGTYKTVSWTLDSNDEMTITGTGDCLGDYFTTVEGGDYTQAKIMRSAMEKAKKIVIGEGINRMYMEPYSSFFSGLTKLEEINIPASIGDIGCLNDCTSLSKFTIADGSAAERYISHGAFHGCTNLKQIDIPSSISQIGIDAFRGCSNLQSVNLSIGLKGIGEFAFGDCKNLKSITLPSGLEHIGSSAFMGSSITKVSLPESLTSG